jgi:outer membrane assembly lipoprotein YfiO
MGRSLLVLVGMMLGCVAATAVAQPRTWQYTGGGRWAAQQRGPTTRPSTRPVVNPLLDRVQQLLDARRGQAAHDIVLDWLKRNPNAPDRDRGLYLLAQAYFQVGDRIWCFYQCDELLDKLPDSRLYFPALELQYRVADSFLNGFRKTFLGLPILSMEDEAIEMLFRIQERSPGSPIAERALLRTGDYYYHTSQFDLAADAYGAFARSFSRSPQVPRVKLQQAFATLAQFRGPRYDATPLIDSRAMFREIIERYPNLGRDENLPEFIDRIDNTLASKLYIEADFYLRTNQPRAAVFIYRMLIKTYPNSRDAAMAKNDLAKMPASALASPTPPAATPLPPTSEPTFPVNPGLPAVTPPTPADSGLRRGAFSP